MIPRIVVVAYGCMFTFHGNQFGTKQTLGMRKIDGWSVAVDGE